MGAIDERSAFTGNAFVELLQNLAHTPLELEQLIRGLSTSQMRTRRSNEEFSIAENLCHLRDIEIEGYTVRIRRLLAEDEPDLADLDGARLAAERDYNSQSATQALKEFQGARSENLLMLNGLEESQLRRGGQLEGVGMISLERLVGLMQQHDEDHVSDLKILCRWLATNEQSVMSDE